MPRIHFEKHIAGMGFNNNADMLLFRYATVPAKPLIAFEMIAFVV